MSLGDIKFRQSGSAFGLKGSRKHQVVAGTPVAINAGELVLKTLGNEYVIKMATNKPAIGTDYIVGVAMTSSTETASADGTVEVKDLTSGEVLLVAPKVAATWATQALYNALVGARVLIDVTSVTETILAADGSTNGCVVENLDVVEVPGQVAFSVRIGAHYLA